MSIVAKVGERTYEFDSFSGLTAAREIYANHTGDANSLEDKFDDAYICYMYEWPADF